MVFSPAIGFRLAIVSVIWASTSFAYAQGTPLNQVIIPDADGKRVDLLTLLKQQRQLTDDQAAHLGEMTVPFTASDKAKVFLKGMRLPNDSFLTDKFAQKLNAAQNERDMGPAPFPSEPPKVVGILKDSGPVDGNVDLPHESTSPLTGAKLPKPGDQKVTLEDAIKYYNDIDQNEPEPVETRSAFHIDEDSEQDLDDAAITPPVLGRCAKDNTVRVKNNYRIDEGPEGIRFDALYVAADTPLEEKLENDEEIAKLGEITDLFPYRSDPGDLLSLKAVEYGANCLPFRIRVTDKFIYFHSGEDALLNYDKNPDGKGAIPKAVGTKDAKSGAKR